MSTRSRRTDQPSHVAAFTDEELIEALVRIYPERFPVLSTIETYRMKFDLSDNTYTLKMWDTPRPT